MGRVSIGRGLELRIALREGDVTRMDNNGPHGTFALVLDSSGAGFVKVRWGVALAETDVSRAAGDPQPLRATPYALEPRELWAGLPLRPGEPRSLPPCGACPCEPMSSRLAVRCRAGGLFDEVRLGCPAGEPL